MSKPQDVEPKAPVVAADPIPKAVDTVPSPPPSDTIVAPLGEEEKGVTNPQGLMPHDFFSFMSEHFAKNGMRVKGWESRLLEVQATVRMIEDDTKAIMLNFTIPDNLEDSWILLSELAHEAYVRLNDGLPAIETK